MAMMVNRIVVGGGARHTGTTATTGILWQDSVLKGSPMKKSRFHPGACGHVSSLQLPGLRHAAY
jgi:hypothetical protein